MVTIGYRGWYSVLVVNNTGRVSVGPAFRPVAEEDPGDTGYPIEG